MKMKVVSTMICSVLVISLLVPAAVHSAPITTDFNVCEPATYKHQSGRQDTILCCPLKTTKQIIDGPPPPLTDILRVRKASQCTDAVYAAKLHKAYSLMRGLPDDDPRSFKQQWHTHCSYCGGSFLTTNSSGCKEEIDIHFSWLFYPWHRWYLYFHERILQTLLDDPTFTLNYWNWDNPYSVGKDSSEDGACLRQGLNFPAIFSDPSTSTYDVNRSDNAKGRGRLHFPDFSFIPELSEYLQPNFTATEEAIIQSNINIMYKALVSGGTTPETFMGRPYRAGDIKGLPGPLGGGGTLDSSAHATVHFWIGRDPPDTSDMGTVGYSSRDPVFFAHHSNIDRLWQVWKDIGPIFGQKREYYSDPDFLNAEFLFYDEKKDLRRVIVADALDTTKLGYVYEGANDAAWLFPDLKSCSKLSLPELIAKAEALPVPKKTGGYYHLQAGTPFVLVIDRPDNPHGIEEFLTIDGIELDTSVIAGFDVFVDLLNPSDLLVPSKCAEYIGRFTNMAQSEQRSATKPLIWKQSVTRTFVDLQAATTPSKVVITLIPFSRSGGYETIKFKCITIDT